MTPHRGEIIHLWNTTPLPASEIGYRCGVTRASVLGLVNRDPRAKPRRPRAPKLAHDERRKIAEAKARRREYMEAQFWKAMRLALLEDIKGQAPLARMEWKAAA